MNSFMATSISLAVSWSGSPALTSVPAVSFCCSRMAERATSIAALQAKREEHGFVALAPEILHGKILTEPRIQAKFRAKIENFTNLGLQNVAWQAIFWNAEMHHSTGHRRGFENGYGITEERQIVRRRHPGRARADNGNFFRPDWAGRSSKNIDGIARFRSVALGDEALQGADGNWHVKLAAAAGWLAGMPADAATDGSERVGDPSVAVRFLVPSLLGVDGTCLHAGKVRLQPLKIDEFGTRGHLAGSLRVPNLLLLNREVNRGGCTAQIHSLRCRFAVFAPCLQRILARGNILDFEIAVFVGHSKIWRGNNHNVAGHFGMDVAKERSCAEVIELERFLLALRPSAEIVGELFDSADRWPIHVMADRVTVQEINRGSLVHGDHMRNERHFPLVDHDVVFWRIEFLVGNRIHVDSDVFCRLDPLHADLSFDFIGPACPCQG